MKKLILAALVIATFGANATQLTKEQQARVDKFNILFSPFYFNVFLFFTVWLISHKSLVFN
jgi:hypothetical protein